MQLSIGANPVEIVVARQCLKSWRNGLDELPERLKHVHLGWLLVSLA